MIKPIGIIFFWILTLGMANGEEVNHSLVLYHINLYDSFINAAPKNALVELDRLNTYKNNSKLPLVLKIRILMCNSRWFLEHGNCDSAMYFARQALQSVKDEKGRMWAVLSMGAAYRCMGYADSSLRYYFLAEKLAKSFDDTIVLIRSYFYLGHVHSELGKFDKARSYYQLSNNLAIAGEDGEFTARTTLALASNLADKGELQQSLVVLHRALLLCKKNNLVRQTAIACNNLGMLYKELLKYEVAIAYFKEALQIEYKLNSQFDIATEHNNIAMILIYQGRHKEAITLLLNAKSIIEKLKEQPMLPEVYHNLSVCYAKINNFKLAYEYNEAQRVLNDSLRGIEMLKHTERLQEEFEAEKRQLEITNLKQENDVKEFKSKAHLKQRNGFIALAVGFFCLGLLVFFLLRQRVRNARQVNKKNALIHQQQMDEVMRKSELQSIHTMLETQEKERKRIAEDLHDRVGSMLSTVRLQFSRFKPTGNENGTEQFEKVGHLLDETCEEIRQVSHNLVSGVLSTFGLLPALNDLAQALCESSHLQIDIQTHGMDVRMESDTEIHIYRMLQELFNNTIRHAQATEVHIDLSRFGNQLTLMYSDNGKGFDTAILEQTGIGLKNLYSRVEKLNGSLHIDSGKGNGSTFVFTFQLI